MASNSSAGIILLLLGMGIIGVLVLILLAKAGVKFVKAFMEEHPEFIKELL